MNVLYSFVINAIEKHKAKQRCVEETKTLADYCISLVKGGVARFYEDNRYIRMRYVVCMVADPPPIQVDTYLWKKHLSDEQLHTIRRLMQNNV